MNDQLWRALCGRFAVFLVAWTLLAALMVADQTQQPERISAPANIQWRLEPCCS